MSTNVIISFSETFAVISLDVFVLWDSFSLIDFNKDFSCSLDGFNVVNVKNSSGPKK